MDLLSSLERRLGRRRGVAVGEREREMEVKTKRFLEHRMIRERMMLKGTGGRLTGCYEREDDETQDVMRGRMTKHKVS